MSPRTPAESPIPAGGPKGRTGRLRTIAQTLLKMGYPPVASVASGARREVDLWVVREGGSVQLPVYISPASTGPRVEEEAAALIRRWSEGNRTAEVALTPSILVVSNDMAASAAARNLFETSPISAPATTTTAAILVVPPEEGRPHWHRYILPPRQVLTLATGTILGLTLRQGSINPEGEGGPNLDFAAMLHHLKFTLHVDVEGSLGVTSEEDALFMLYQLAIRYGYAPGDHGSSLHMLTLKPSSPASRVPFYGI